MTIQLYMTPGSPPSQSVQMTAKALGINLELIPIDWKNEEHKSPEFLKLNPQHTMPVINDNGIILWESHAINAYLVTKYSKNDSLYPKDLVKRAIVDQRLHFDTGVLFARITPMLYKNKKTIDPAEIDSINEAYGFLEDFIEGRKWIAGDSVTIADYNIYTSLGFSNILVPVDSNKFPKLNAWYKRVDALPESDVTKKGLKEAVDDIKELLEK